MKTPLLLWLHAAIACGAVLGCISERGGGTGGTGGAGAQGGGGATGGSTAETGGSAGSSGTTSTDTITGALPVELTCGPTGSQPVPPLYKACASVDDCVLKYHQVDCCGTSDAIGMNAAQAPAFDDAEATCKADYSPCGCPASYTSTEDGKKASSFGDIDVRCLDGHCQSYKK
ncbi:MAG: hypothetical protein R3B70_37295 [Polyangiaceae bacterium]